MSKTKRQFGTDSTDPRTRLAGSIKVGDTLRESRVSGVYPERKGGKAGYRIRLRDGRAAWAAPDTRIADVRFDLPATRR